RSGHRPLSNRSRPGNLTNRRSGKAGCATASRRNQDDTAGGCRNEEPGMHGRKSPSAHRRAGPTKGLRMNWDRISGNWTQVKGRAKQQWGKLTDDDLDYIDGRREELAGRIQERYGIAQDEADREIDDWTRGF